MTTLITGATGFLGKNLLTMLLENGEKVRALVRNPDALGVRHDNLEIFKGDLTDPISLSTAVKGASRIYHVAAAVKEWVKDWSIFQRVNVDAFEALLTIAGAEGVERVVYTSSFFALGHTDRQRIADESLVHEPEHHHNPYERTKYLAYQIAKKYASQGIPIVTMMPGVIFGPGELTEGNLVVGMLMDMVRGKFPGIPGDGKKLWAYSFVRDVARGHILAMEKGTLGETYILGGDNIDLNYFVDVAARELRVKVPRIHLPLGLLDVSAWFMEVIAKWTGKPPMLTRGKVGVLAHNWAYSSKKAQDQLGYTITPFDEGMAETVRWMREKGLLPA
jgi:NAD+-dependent farnesol dehydrogenase